MKEVVVKKFRLATVAAIGALVASAGVMFPASAQAAPTYWQFQNARFGTCLTAGDSGSAYATTCQGSNRQQWDWTGDGVGLYHMLRNRETGKCLRTDKTTNTNAVWTSDCDSGFGEWWYYDGGTQHLYTEIGNARSGFLRTSDVKDAVYSTVLNQAGIGSSYYVWAGTHN